MNQGPLYSEHHILRDVWYLNPNLLRDLHGIPGSSNPSLSVVGSWKGSAWCTVLQERTQLTRMMLGIQCSSGNADPATRPFPLLPCALAQLDESCEAAETMGPPPTGPLPIEPRVSVLQALSWPCTDFCLSHFPHDSYSLPWVTQILQAV
jgi:hypothetical protein